VRCVEEGTATMEGRCEKHPFERMERNCRACGGEFCADCLVYSYGPKKPPYCVNCALSAAGVRSTAARPQIRSKREIKRDMKVAKRQEKLAAKTRVEVDASLLLQAQPVGAPPVGPRDEMLFEFTINDDGSIDREAEVATVVAEPAPEPVAQPEPEPVPAGKSIFDY
jgi:hypothetical protein